MLRAIIIDDEEAGIETLKILASRNTGSIRIVATASRPEDGIVLIEDYKPDVVFLDINMPAMSGFELLEKLSFRAFRLIFTTAHREYALQAIKNKAFDYLLKPIADADFTSCIHEMLSERNPPSLAVKQDPNLFIEIQVKDGVIFLKQKDIIRLEASRSYTALYLDNHVKYVASKNLGDFEGQLDPGTFFRCHKSHIINLHKVQKFVNHDGLFALMSDDSMPDISRTLKEALLQRLKKI